MRRTGVISLTCLVVGLVVAGCNHDGRTLRPARPDQNASISTTSMATTTVAPDVIGGEDPSASGGIGGSVKGSLLPTSTSLVDGLQPTTTSIAGGLQPTTTSIVGSVVTARSVLAPWRDGAAIDARYTCSGANVSPPLSWSPAPAGTSEIAITMTDEQAPTFVHWAIGGLGPDATTIDEGEVPEGATQALNGAGGSGYTGPCPPQGATHTYVITVHFLDSELELGDGAGGGDMLVAIDAATAAEARVSGTFSRV